MVFIIRAIVEVIGLPESHVNDIASKVLENLKKENGITIIKENYSKAELVKSDIFASHVEVELKIGDISRLIDFCYEYLPSSIEILDTEKVFIPAMELNNALSEMLRKLHSFNLLLHNLNEKNKELNSMINFNKEKNNIQKENDIKND